VEGEQRGSWAYFRVLPDQFCSLSELLIQPGAPNGFRGRSTPLGDESVR
jgi:hypothetical protein